MAREHHFVGLDIGSSTVRVVVAGKNLEIIGVGEAPADGVRRGALVFPDQTAKSISRAFYDLRKSAGIHIDHATVSLGEPRIATYNTRAVVSISRADGVVTKEDIARVHEAAEAALPRMTNRDIIHTFPLHYSVDHDSRLREPEGLVGTKLEVDMLFVASFTQNFKKIIRAAELAGISVDDVVASPLAASYHAMTKKHKEVGSLLLDIGAGTSSLAVFEEGMLVSLEVIPVGSGHITYDISLGFQIDLSSAEQVKRNLAAYLEQGKKEIRLSELPKNFEDAFTPRKLKDIVSARLGDIFELVTKHLKKINRAELLPGGVVLTGGGARLYDIVPQARSELRLPVEIPSATAGLSGRTQSVAGPEWATAVGLARYAVDEYMPTSRMGDLLASSFTKQIRKIFRAFIP